MFQAVNEIPRKLLFLVVVCAVALLASCSEGPTEAQRIRQLQRSGQLELAEARIAEALAAGGIEPEAAQRLRDDTPRWREAFARAERIIVATLHQLDERSAYVELRNLEERSGSAPFYQAALQHELGPKRFAHWVAEAPRRPRMHLPEPEEPITGGPGVGQEPEPRVSEGDEEIFGAAAYRSLEADVMRLVDERDYGAALMMVREQLPLAGSSADRLRDLLWKVEDRARADMDQVLARVAELEGSGELEAALALTRREMEHFPSSGTLARLTHVAEDFVQRIERKSAPPPPEWIVGPGAKKPSTGGAGTSEPVAAPGTREARVAAAILASEERRYADAAALFEGLAVEFESVNPRLHSLYRTEADEARLLGYAKEAVERALEKPESARALRQVPIGRGRQGRILSASPEGLRVAVQGAMEGTEEDVPWTVLSDPEFAAIVSAAIETPLEQLGLAVLQFRLQNDDEAEKLLRFALRRDKTVQPLLDRILAKARGEALPEGGYVLDRNDFVARDVLLRREHEREIQDLVAKCLRQRSDEQRDAVFEEIREQGDFAEQLAKEALLQKREELLGEVQQAPVRTSLQKLLALRRELDERRRHALELIFDTDKYFYPYKPPAVSGEKARLYGEVQAEVTRRVQAVQEIWDGRGISVAVSGPLAKKLEVLRWTQKCLVDLGADVGEAGDIDRLVLGQGISIRNVALDASDQRYMDYWAETDAYNEKQLEEWVRDKKISRGQAELVRITNAYREMMGRHPLRVDLRVMRAAQGHTEEMATMGYFSHFSPTEGRRTPQERMRLEGYPNPGGENLAINGGAEAAVWAWRHSSGHHRNMLSKGHGDLGTGVSGRYFAQNFGGGLGRWR